MGELRLVPPTAEGLADVDVLCTFAGFFLHRDVLESAPRLLACVDLGTAIHCDVDAATDLGIAVLHAPGANAQAVAEHTVGLALALGNGIVRSDRRMRSGEFKLAHVRTWGLEFQGRTIGLVGFGHVARRVARIAQAGLGMRVLVWCRQPEEAESAGYEPVALPELMGSADLVSVHLALNPETRGLLSGSLLRLIKPGALVVVTARVEVLDLDTLTELVVQERIAGAALDTWPDHIPDYSSPLMDHPNVVLTEANAGLTDIAARNMADAVADAVRATLQGTPPTVATIANPQAWPPRPAGGRTL
jgi:D-3-phosphoglycerate dehydrogenase